MTHYPDFDPNAELNGRTVTAFIRNINHKDIANILRRHQLSTIDPTQWYSLQAVLNVLAEISDGPNGSEILVAIGMAAAQLAVENAPPELVKVPLEQWLRAYCETIYPSRQRNGYAGEFSLHTENELHLILTMYSPYPDDLMYGLFYTYVRHYSSADIHFVLRYDDTARRRGQGGPNTIFHIRGTRVTPP